MRTISYTHLPQTDMNFDSSSTGMSWLYGETLLDLTSRYETPLHPCGFVFKFMFLSTWSDVRISMSRRHCSNCMLITS